MPHDSYCERLAEEIRRLRAIGALSERASLVAGALALLDADERDQLGLIVLSAPIKGILKRRHVDEAELALLDKIHRSALALAEQADAADAIPAAALSAAA